MREVKFQGIYRPTGEKFEVYKLDLLNEIVHGAFDGSKSDWCIYSVTANGKGDAWVREYTGLNDMNGVEIYDGDIVHTTGMTIDNRGVVKFIDGAWVVEAFDQKDGWFLFQEIEENEVVGNVFSNQDLIGEAI